MTIVGVILARGGSKRLAGKNVRALNGKPLIAYTVEAARAATGLGRTVVSTDDPEIAEAARTAGGEAPFMRPAHLATDDSASIDALRHAVEWLETDGEAVEAVVLLQPTSPLRSGRHIDEAIARYRSTGADTVTSVSPAPAHPFYCWRANEDGLEPYFSRPEMALAKQQLPDAWIENGAVYVISRAQLRTGSIYGPRVAGYVMDDQDSVDIDTLADFETAAAILASR